MPVIPGTQPSRLASWIVCVGLGAGAVGYVVTAAAALRHPLNPGAEAEWVVIFGILAIVAVVSSVVLRRVAFVVFCLSVAALSLVLIVLSGRLAAALMTAWVLALAAAWGASVMGWVGAAMPGGLERTAIALPLGLAVLALVGLGLGLAHALGPRPIVITLVGLTLVRARIFLGTARRLGRVWPSLTCSTAVDAVAERNALVLALGVSWLLALTWAVAPEVNFDALNYHLAVPRIYLAHGRLVDLPYFFHSYYAHLVDMLFALGLALDGEAVAKLMMLAVGGVVSVGTYVLGRDIFGPRAGLWAACLFASTPLVVSHAPTANTDVPTAMFLLGSFLALLRWQDSRSVGWAWISGSLAGAALGTKLSALLALPAFVVVLGWTLWREPLRKQAAPLSAYAFGGLLFAVPWYAVTYAFTGNPFFPLLNGVFKSPGWPPVNALPNEMFGIGTSMSAMVALPWALTSQTQKFGEALAPGAMGLGVALLPLGALLLARHGGRHRRALVGTAALSTIVWSVVSQYARFLVPILPLIVIVVAGAVWHVGSDPTARRFIVATLGLVLVVQLAVAPLLFWYIPERFPLRRALGLEPAEAFLSRALPAYLAARYINRVAAPGERVIGPGFANLRYYLDPPLESGETPNRPAIETHDSPAALARALRQHGYAFLMVNTWSMDRGATFPFTRPEFLECCAVPTFARPGVVVYRIGVRVPGATPQGNLLRNPGFETLNDAGEVVAWSAYGHPMIGGTDAHLGRIAVGASLGAGLTQPVAVEAGRLYVLSHVTRADRPDQYARLQINWLNARGQIMEASIEVASVDARWQRRTMMVTAPEGATTAVVYTSVHGDSRVWFDDFALATGE